MATKGRVVARSDLRTAGIGDFLTFAYEGPTPAELWFRVDAPGVSKTVRAGVQRLGQFQVAQLGVHRVAFTDGERDLAGARFTLK